MASCFAIFAASESSRTSGSFARSRRSVRPAAIADLVLIADLDRLAQSSDFDNGHAVSHIYALVASH